ncbi:MinD/ParA family protein, partial [Streptomyces sp. SID3212]|uniref:MinD/ParA family ATP-binding protein n=1 Tax=Streptomyces sp. SID3212 TaxID=2690259 RepID=UPI00136AFF56
MLDDASLVAAAAAGAAVAEATTTDQWTVVRGWAARFLARGDLRAEQEHLKRLDLSAAAVRQAHDPELRVRVEAALQTRFELLLEESPGVERAERATELFRLAQLSRSPYATVTAPATAGAVSFDGGTGSPVTLVGRIPSEAVPFRHRAEAALLDGAPSSHVLAGPAGTGKTQLAAHLARRALRDGSADLVVWVNAASGDALVCGYADAAAATTDHDPGQPERSAEAFRSWLSWTDRRWLVVLDGVPDTANLHGLWPPARPNGRVLVTARRATSLPDGGGCSEIGPYLPEEAADQLTRELLRHGRVDDPADVAALAAGLRQHPSALSTAAACMAHSGLTCAAHHDLLTRLAGPGGAGPTRDAVTAGWWLAVETADRQCAGLARPVLELAAVLDPHGVPVAVLTSRPALRYLALRRGRQAPEASLPVEARDVLDALDVLRRLRLVEPDSDTAHPAVRLSTLVQTAVRRAVPAEARDALFLSAADALHTLWRTASDQPRSLLCRALRSGADLLTGHAGEALWRSHCHALLFQVGRNLIDAGMVRAARIRWDWLYARLDQRFGPDHADTLAARGYQARVRGASQDAAGAVAAYRELLHDLERVLGLDNPDVFTVRDNLARWQGIAGDPARAAVAYTELLADRLPVLGPAHPDTLLTRHNIALWRGRAGDAAGAAAAYAELLDDMGRAFEANHPAVLEIRDQLTEWRNRAADVAAAARVPATTGPRPDQLEPGLWSPPAADDGIRPPAEGTPLSAQQLLLEPPWFSRLRRLLTQRGRPAAEGPPSVAGPGSPIAGCHRVSVISLKGGTGKTTTAAALGATLAGLRDEPVIAVDASPEGGTLGHRVHRENDSTILDLLAALPELDGHDDIRRFTSTGPNGLEVLAHDVTPTLSTPFGTQQYHRVVDALSRAYSLVVTDSGTGLMQEALRGVLARTDQLVVVATASVDGAAVADVTLDWLSQHGHAELARRALVVLSAVHPGPTLVRTDRIVEHFSGRCHGVVTIPFDAHLATGAELDLTQLRADTRRAYAELASLVATGFPHAPGNRKKQGDPTEPPAAVVRSEPHTRPAAVTAPEPPVEPAAVTAPEPPAETAAVAGFCAPEPPCVSAAPPAPAPAPAGAP